MTLQLFGHPFSSYTWKALIALYENATPFAFRMLDGDHPDHAAEFARLWPVRKFPLLVDDGVPVMESSAIVEHLQLNHPGPVTLIPADPVAAQQVRLFDRIFDNCVMNAFQPVVNDALKPPERRDPRDVADAMERTGRVYPWLNARMAGRDWAVGETGSPWPTCPPRRRYSTPTGCYRSARSSRICAPIAPGCSRGHRWRDASMRRGPIANSSRSAHPAGTDQKDSR